ncbi:hypothetical protein RUM43_010455 [Polyplax serrata]|uniref:Proteasome assembly chaperone 1 n=1 Tax=Polyplax serrata TaxID=468196 RepID=A0AAN8S0H9_POLSC
MALFFGEIVEPSTRAIFDEFSDEEENAVERPKRINIPVRDLCFRQLNVSWNGGDKNLPPIIEVCFIVQGRLSLAFAEICLIDETCVKIGEINVTQSEDNNEGVPEYPKEKVTPSRIYRDNHNVICLISPSLSSTLGYQLVGETITPLLKLSKKIVILTNDSVYNYKTHFLQNLPPAFIKELKTSHGSHSHIAEPIETPNFITGIPAAVFTWCEIFKKDASAFICYSDQEKLDSITAEPYISVLRKVNKDIIKKENLDFNKKTIYGKPGMIGGSSNIYI